MSEISQYQNVFRIAKREATAQTNSSRPTKGKRNRQALSCLSCRARKLKCDRQSPCTTCSKNGIGLSCNYSVRPSNGHERRDEGLRTSEAHLRLQKLEEMVTSLMQKTRDGSDGPTSDTSASNATIERSISTLSVNGSLHPLNGTSNGKHDYQGGTHWSAILENIRDIQGVLEPDTEPNEEAPPFHAATSTDIIMKTRTTFTLADVFESLPPRPQVDSLIYVYFSAKDTRNPIIHSKKFLREYESFWVNPSSMPFLWISILFSTLYIGSSLERAASAGVVHSIDASARSRFLDSACAALVAGGYQNAQPYSVEAVLIVAYCKFLQRDHPDADAWMIMGTAARLALRMGYHRDPRQFPNLSPFEGEMRRRVFFLVESFDLLLSFQAGLPPIISEDECDTEAPRNLLDADFDEDCTELPPSRPATESTPMLYFRYKSLFAKIFRRVIRHALSLKNHKYEDTMRLDRELLQMHSEIPPCLKMRPLISFTTEGASMVLNLLNVDLMYLTCVCVLHRQYITHERSNGKYEYSRRVCVNAALQILAHQTELHALCQPGGRFFEDKWMISTLLLYYFILAGLVVCLDLFESRNTACNLSPMDVRTQAERYEILTHTLDIWNERRESSRDARRASNILSVMLSKIPRPVISSASTNVHQGNDIQSQSNGVTLTVVQSTSSVDVTWDSGANSLPNDEFSARNNAAFDFSSALFTESDQIDWALVDQYLIDCGVMSDVPLEWGN
ncbi:hypothetical protein N431DRAFT_548239 [Stipitochalara longipes BDJ]|nr:hypothetical protein N431DRAFT_548239 [Stipitochalara longipes BDJ]